MTRWTVTHYCCAHLAREVTTVVFHTSFGFFGTLATRHPTATFPMRCVAIGALLDCISPWLISPVTESPVHTARVLLVEPL